MATAKLRVGDLVKVIAGRSRGETGRVSKIEGDQVFIDGVNLLKKSVKRDPSREASEHHEGYRTVSAPVHRSNVALYDTQSAKTFKVAIREVDGKNVRVNRKTGDMIVAEIEAKS